MGEYIDLLLAELKKYQGREVDTLLNTFGIASTAKSKNYLLANEMIASLEGKKIAKAKLESNRINVKTIQLKENGFPKESMSFAPIDYKKIITEEWNTSLFHQYLTNTFLFFVFKQKSGPNILEKVFKWTVPESDLNGEIKLVWEDTKKKIAEGTLIKEIKNKKIITWFMPEKVTNICHVRPHGSNGADVTEIPVPDRLTGYQHISKQSFWFNHTYIKKIVDAF